MVWPYADAILLVQRRSAYQISWRPLVNLVYFPLSEDGDHDLSLWHADSFLSNQSSYCHADCSASFSDDSCLPKPQAIPRLTINLPTSRCYATPTLLSGPGFNKNSPTWSTTYMFRQSPSCSTDAERVDGLRVIGASPAVGSSLLVPPQSSSVSQSASQQPQKQVYALSPVPTPSMNNNTHVKPAIPSHCDTPRSRRPALKTLNTDPQNVTHSQMRKAPKTMSRVARAKKRPSSTVTACTSQSKVPFFWYSLVHIYREFWSNCNSGA